MSDKERFYEASLAGPRRSAPAALRNREPIAEVLADWLPPRGVVLEIASGTGEHALFFAEHFPRLQWQPTDVHSDALRSINSWREVTAVENLRAPIRLDAASGDWPAIALEAALANSLPTSNEKPTSTAIYSAVLCINMAHISAWSASLGLLDGAARLLPAGGALIIYGPWLKADTPPAPSNLDFDQQLRQRDPEWGLRRVEDFEAEAGTRGFALEQLRTMPANNLMLLFRLARIDARRASSGAAA